MLPTVTPSAMASTRTSSVRQRSHLKSLTQTGRVAVAQSALPQRVDGKWYLTISPIPPPINDDGIHGDDGTLMDTLGPLFEAGQAGQAVITVEAVNGFTVESFGIDRALSAQEIAGL